MTDKDKFIKLFKEIGIDYEENDCEIRIGNYSMSEMYNSKRWGETLSVVFDENGKFKYFEAWGE